ncbi:uncharacterized protein [Watersipora subatra]|uniref:uncharacterized protein n=1 Tax=Watersipora subatra TaxID=2589382 RepID=UPI00355B6A6D
MRAYRGNPHTVTGEMTNFMMFDRELRLPDQLECHPPPTETQSASDYVLQRQQRLEEAHEALSEAQMETRQADQEEPPLFTPGGWVWLVNRWRRRGPNAKLKAKFMGPYQVITAWPNHTYVVERQSQTSTQHKFRLKPYYACSGSSGRAPATLDLRRGPNMKGARMARPS